MPELPDLSNTPESLPHYSPIDPKHPWWDYSHADGDWSEAWSVVGPTMVRQAAAGGAVVRELIRSGRATTGDVNMGAFATEVGLRVLFESSQRTHAILGDADTFALWTNRVGHITVDLLTRSFASFEMIEKWCLAHLVDHIDDSDAGPIYTLQQGPHGVSLLHLGTAGVPLVRTNYSPHVVSAFDHVGQELKAASPCGRVVLLSGSTGTGKTHMIRALLRECPLGTFVLVPPAMLESVGDPRILPAILEVHNVSAGPIVFVLEDADTCFVPRASDNIASISALLNLGDGILGSLLDMRILATTNAKKFQVDPAVLRNGRLCRHIEIQPLAGGDATRALRSICGDGMLPGYQSADGAEITFGVATSLADVYARARALGWLPPKPEGHTERQECALRRHRWRRRG